MLSKIVSICSLILLTCQLALGTDYVKLRQDFLSAQTADARLSVLDDSLNQDHDWYQDPNLQSLMQDVVDEDKITPAQEKRIESMLDSRAAAQAKTSQVDASAESQIKSIKSSPAYRTESTKDSSNWLAKAFERLQDLFRGSPPSTDFRVPQRGTDFGRILVYIVIVILGGILAVFLVLLVRHFRWQRRIRRRASALLDEDEPERTADEWLGLSESLALQGRYREAVRCLYLACLLRFDESGVARFNRSETNWEHLARVQASPQRPAELDFLPPTQFFDRIWYGHQVRGQEDVDQFRLWYGSIMLMLRKEAA